MRIPISIIAAAILCSGSATGAQNAPSGTLQSPPSTATSEELNSQSPIGGVEVLSDTEGVDFKDFLVQWHRITETTWQQLTPKEAGTRGLQSGTVAIRFKIMPSGKMMDGGMVLEERSGNSQLDRAAWDAIAKSAYPQLPEEFHGPYLELRAHFVYKNHLAK